MPSKPELLYLSPVIPALTGNGLAMRAGMVLEALAEHYSISLLVVSLYPSRTVRVPAVFERLCRRSVVITPAQFTGPRLSFLPSFLSSRFARRPYHGSHFDVVHVFRLAMLPFARPFLDGSSGTPRRFLDLDDIESATHRSLAALCRLNGKRARAHFYEMEARRYEALEEEVLRGFDRLYVCSEGDRARLPVNHRSELCVLPNAVRLPEMARQESSGRVFTFLFVGTLGYYPNEDAVRYFGSEILPRIRELTRSEFMVNVVGTGASESLRKSASDSGMHMIGEVADIAPWYENANAVVVPVRAGGGTRIKVLEAFSHCRPVVSTSIGIEGIDARDDEHVLIADSPEVFAQHCLRLLGDSGLRDRLVENAFSLLRQSYSTEAVKKTLASLFASPVH
jgi:glycosyltransferase involved in cell wall biosynthesis